MSDGFVTEREIDLWIERYQALKGQHPNGVVLMRQGDFYEVLGPDAKRVAVGFGLTLNSRRSTEQGDLPMVGVPAHAMQRYAKWLREAGQELIMADSNGVPEAEAADEKAQAPESAWQSKGKMVSGGRSQKPSPLTTADAVCDAEGGLRLRFATGALAKLTELTFNPGEATEFLWTLFTSLIDANPKPHNPLPGLVTKIAGHLRKQEGTTWPEPSEAFKTACVHSGSLVIDCGFCGRTHFATRSGGDFEEGEVERLRDQARQHPDRYMEYPQDDTVAWGMLGGYQAPVDCPCHSLTFYEQVVWRHRKLFTAYLTERAQDQLIAATADAQTAADFQLAVEDLTDAPDSDPEA